ncbi:DUF4400 domain-containing protein [Neisseria sp.]|uniref:DUF4400 domain-containing protein n=1 Tax=Neisseria sp. TaxID=192066 RepID=UPI0035A0A4CB
MLIALLMFGASLIVQSNYQQQHLLAHELETTLRMFAGRDGGYHTVITKYAYQGLHHLFFDLTGINDLIEYGPQSTIGEHIWSVLQPHQDKLLRLDQAFKIISVRLGNLSAYLPLLIILAAVSIYDGLMQRKIRQSNATRESAAIYHMSIYWRFGVIWTSVILYLCLPVSLSPALLLLPITFICVLMHIQARYLKKYL